MGGVKNFQHKHTQVVHFEAEMFKCRLSKELDEIIDPMKKYDRSKFGQGSSYRGIMYITYRVPIDDVQNCQLCDPTIF